jgi:hypothetical protein
MKKNLTVCIYVCMYVCMYVYIFFSKKMLFAYISSALKQFSQNGIFLFIPGNPDMGSDKYYTVHKVSRLHSTALSLWEQRASWTLTCWLFSGSSFSCVLFPLGYLSEADAIQSVKTKCKKKKIFPLHYFAMRKNVCNWRDTGMPRHITFLPLSWLMMPVPLCRNAREG